MSSAMEITVTRETEYRFRYGESVEIVITVDEENKKVRFRVYGNDPSGEIPMDDALELISAIYSKLEPF